MAYDFCTIVTVYTQKQHGQAEYRPREPVCQRAADYNYQGVSIVRGCKRKKRNNRPAYDIAENKQEQSSYQPEGRSLFEISEIGRFIQGFTAVFCRRNPVSQPV